MPGKGGKLGAHVSPAAHTRTAKVKWRCFFPFDKQSSPPAVHFSCCRCSSFSQQSVQLSASLVYTRNLRCRGSSSSEEEARAGIRDPEHRQLYSVSVESYASVWARWQKDVTSFWGGSCCLFIAQHRLFPKVRAVCVRVHACLLWVFTAL